MDTVLWLCPSLPIQILKWLSSLLILVQDSFWWWQCSDRYIISLFLHLHNPPFSPSLISLMVSVDVKHYVYFIQRSWFARGNECPLQSFTQEVAKGRSCRFRADFWVGVGSRCAREWVLNLELRSSTNAIIFAFARIRGERWRTMKKSAFESFAGLQEDRECMAWPGFFFFFFFGHPVAQTPKFLLVTKHNLTTGFQKCL